MGKIMKRRMVKAIWQTAEPDAVALYQDLTDGGMDHGTALDWVVDEVVEWIPTLGGALEALADRLGDRVDAVLGWSRVTDPDLKAWLEAHDNPAPLLKALIRFGVRMRVRTGQDTPLRGAVRRPLP